MSALDDLKKNWNGGQQAFQAAGPYDAASFNQLIQARMKKQNNMIFRYFWATFTLHVLVYALLTHVMVRYGADTDTLVLGLIGFLVTVPFTAVMLKRYKQMAVSSANNASLASIYTYVKQQRSQLNNFYTFKKKYELVLIPLLSAVGVILVFNLYFPGGVLSFLTGAIITYILSLLSCFWAIHTEDKKYFIRPLQELGSILDDYKSEG